MYQEDIYSAIIYGKAKCGSLLGSSEWKSVAPGGSLLVVKAENLWVCLYVVVGQTLTHSRLYYYSAILSHKAVTHLPSHREWKVESTWVSQ